jgi:glycosyltransferase involved in cell wall biosynthesis
MIDGAAPNAQSPGGTIIAYRDLLIPRSELYFLRRLYVAFERLRPLWVGRRAGDGIGDLDGESLILGGPDPLGAIDRGLFKLTGRLPPVPDLRARKPRLVHAHFGRGGALALPMARALGVPLVVSFYGGDATKDKHYDRRWFPSIYQRRLPALMEQAALFLCVSDFIRRQLIDRGFPEGKLLVQRSGVNLDPEWGPIDPSARPYVLFAGRFVEKKGAALVIEAVRRLEAESGQPLPLVMIGEGPLEGTLRAAAAALRDVTFLGWMSNTELRRWMRGALALCVPSLRAADGDAEGLPTVVIEAMAAGTPVIGSMHAGIGEAIEDQRTGYLIPERDPGALAAALARLATNPSLRHDMGETARAAAVEGFDMTRQSRRLEDRLLEVIAARG